MGEGGGAYSEGLGVPTIRVCSLAVQSVVHGSVAWISPKDMVTTQRLVRNTDPSPDILNHNLHFDKIPCLSLRSRSAH